MNRFRKSETGSGGRRWMQGALIASSICLVAACSDSDNGTDNAAPGSDDAGSTMYR